MNTGKNEDIAKKLLVERVFKVNSNSVLVAELKYFSVRENFSGWSVCF